MKNVQLHKNFDTGTFRIGASKPKQICWYFCNILFFKSEFIPFSVILVPVLKLFGAKIGKQVRIKPGIHIKYPWKLEVGDFSWLADCYIENLAPVKIGKNCCISQKAMLITGNHNYKTTTFDLITNQIILEDGVWIGANATVAPGVIAFSHSLLTLGSVATHNMESYSIYQGNPAKKVKARTID